MEIINGKQLIDNGLSVIGGMTGSLSGSVSFATSASFAISASFAPGTPAFPFSGSAAVTGSVQFAFVTSSAGSTAWSAGGALITGRQELVGAGTQNEGLAFGGRLATPSFTALSCTEEYNGSSWSAGGALITARRRLAGAGTQNAGLAFSGYSPDASCTEEYDGSSWTAGGALITAIYDRGGAGTQNAALAFGGGAYPSVVSCTEEYAIAPGSTITVKTFDYSSTTGNVSLRVESQQTTLNNNSGSLGQLSVSGSSLYFHNGSIWKLVTLS